jgi:hypothetical protein
MNLCLAINGSVWTARVSVRVSVTFVDHVQSFELSSFGLGA